MMINKPFPVVLISLNMIMRPDRHKEGSVLPKTPVTIITGRPEAQSPSHPLDVTTPRQLDINSCPSSPVRRVVSSCSSKPLVGKLVAKVIGYVPQVLCFESERFCGFDASECGRGGWKPLLERAAEAPREKLVPEEATGLEHAHCHHPSAEVLAALDSAAHDKHYSRHRVSFSYDLLGWNPRKFECIDQMIDVSEEDF